MDHKLLLYDLAGGADGVRQLVEIFYDIVETAPEGAPLHILHMRGHGVAHARIEQFDFLSGFFGGPRLYLERHGHSNVRTMHAHVEINAEARDAWISCMSMAIDKVGLTPEVKAQMMEPFRRVAQILVNKD
jgi:hemoglobin